MSIEQTGGSGSRPAKRGLIVAGVVVLLLALVVVIVRPWRGRPDPRPVEIPMNGIDEDGDGFDSYASANVLIILVDTLRFDHLGYMGYRRNTSPHLDALSRESVVFENAYSHAPWTHPSTASILTGLHPKDLGIRQWDHKLKKEQRLLSEILHDAGYHTAAYVAHDMYRKDYGYKQGWDVCDSSVIKDKKLQSVTTSHILSDLAIKALDGIPEPFFMLLHYFDPHWKYTKHEGFAFWGRNPIDRYDSEIAFTDHHIGRVLEALESAGLADRTIVVFVADHGEEFRDHGDTQHTNQVYEELIHIPLLFRIPGFHHANVPTLVAESDIVPTLAKMLGLEVPEAVSGVPILFGMEGVVADDAMVFSETRRGADKTSIVEDGFKLIIVRQETLEIRNKAKERGEGEDVGRRVELFDLGKDPGERHDLSSKMPEKTSELTSKILEYYEDSETNPETFELDEETIQNLKSLGYIE